MLGVLRGWIVHLRRLLTGQTRQALSDSVQGEDLGQAPECSINVTISLNNFYCQASCRAQGTSVGTQVPSPVVEKEDHVGGANTECQVSHGEHKEMWQCRGGAAQDLRGCQASQRGPPPNPRPEGGREGVKGQWREEAESRAGLHHKGLAYHMRELDSILRVSGSH